MKTAAPDRSFARGLRCLDEGRTIEALAYFEASLRLEESAPNIARRARYLSYYGYSLALALGRTKEGLSICRKAADSEFFTPDILLNLARVQRLSKDRKGAWETLMRGLSIDPEHAGIKTEIRTMGLRRRPAIPFLKRSNPLNVAAGKMAVKPALKRRK